MAQETTLNSTAKLLEEFKSVNNDLSELKHYRKKAGISKF